MASSTDGAIYLWNANNGNSMTNLYGHDGAVQIALFTDDGKGVISAGADGILRNWSVVNGKEKTIIKGRLFHEGEILSMSLKGDRQLALTGGSDGHYCLSGYEDGKIFYKSEELSGPIEGSSFATGFY